MARAKCPWHGTQSQLEGGAGRAPYSSSLSQIFFQSSEYDKECDEQGGEGVKATLVPISLPRVLQDFEFMTLLSEKRIDSLTKHEACSKQRSRLDRRFSSSKQGGAGGEPTRQPVPSQVCQTRDQSLAAHDAARPSTNNHSNPRLASKCKLSQHRVGGELQAGTRSTLSRGWKGNTLKLRRGEVCGSADVSISSGYRRRLPWTYTNTDSHCANIHIHCKAFQQWWSYAQ